MFKNFINIFLSIYLILSSIGCASNILPLTNTDIPKSFGLKSTTDLNYKK